jgi:hypothetical protein
VVLEAIPYSPDDRLPDGVVRFHLIYRATTYRQGKTIVQIPQSTHPIRGAETASDAFAMYDEAYTEADGIYKTKAREAILRKR